MWYVVQDLRNLRMGQSLLGARMRKSCSYQNTPVVAPFNDHQQGSLGSPVVRTPVGQTNQMGNQDNHME